MSNPVSYNDWGIAVSELLALAGTCMEKEKRHPYYKWWQAGVTVEEAAVKILGTEVDAEIAPTFEFICHLRRTPDGRVLLLGLPKGNLPIADSLMPDMGDAGSVIRISFPELVDRTEYGKGKSHLDIIEEGFS